MKGFTIMLSICILFASCATSKRYTQTNLYFGLSKPDGQIINDSMFQVFVENYAVKVFPAGYTVYDTNGGWYDPETHTMHPEASKIISSVNRMSGRFSDSVDYLRNQYKKMFSQQSVLRVDQRAVVNF